MANTKVLPLNDEEPHHLLKLMTEDDCEVLLVSGGPFRAYLWIGGKDGYCQTTIGGEKALRALATAILKELDSPVPRKQRTKKTRVV